MTLNPVFVGVAGTILAELLLLFSWAVFMVWHDDNK